MTLKVPYAKKCACNMHLTDNNMRKATCMLNECCKRFLHSLNMHVSCNMRGFAVPPTLARCFQYFFAIFQYFYGHFIFLTGVTSNSRRWEVVKLSVSPKRPFFFTLPGVTCSFLFLNFFLLSSVSTLHSKRAG